MPAVVFSFKGIKTAGIYFGACPKNQAATSSKRTNELARTKSKDYDGIRKKILRKAAALFAAKSYSRTTIGDLAKATTSSRGALYHYFDSKEEILRDILIVHIGEMIETVKAVVKETDDPQETCVRVIAAIIRMNTASANESIVLMSEQRFLNRTERDKIRSLQNEVVDLVLSTLRAADTVDRISEHNAKAYAMTLFGMTNYIYTWYDQKGSLEPDELAAMVADVFLHGFFNPTQET